MHIVYFALNEYCYPSDYMYEHNSNVVYSKQLLSGNKIIVSGHGLGGACNHVKRLSKETGVKSIYGKENKEDIEPNNSQCILGIVLRQ